ncbi:short chain dehydrogenase [Paenibacillus soyae]|uniref:Short chain dehydrogenase n=1 Tax=Paenibacillus soyae TaxID=2969249 RepID=A0A9X2MYE4_9BACL|nr:short chain dehydrogenase [Paenibacillus soyae]MCR2805752.1 short chain dehydrogenase [Paenibacillus soyae]
MKILLVGASGTIGRAVRDELALRHEVLSAGRHSGEVAVDLTSPDSIRSMYQTVGKVDAVVSTAGKTFFGALQELTPENNEISIRSKLVGQMNLVLLGLNHVNDGGSFTLITGIIMDDPIVSGTSAAMTGGAIRSFVKSAAIEMPRGIRINNVSPTIVQESMETYGPYFPGFVPVPASRVAQAFRKSVEGGQTGQTYTVY